MTLRWLVVLCAAVLAASCGSNPQRDARGFVERGDAFVRDGRDDAAVIEYRNAVRVWPTAADAHQKLGEAYQRLGRIDEAYQAYAAASNIVDGQTLPGDEESLRALVAKRPTLVAARLALADMLIARDNRDEAEEQLRAATAIEPANELANRSLAAIYFASRRTDEGERCLRIAAAQEPNRYRSRLALADFLMEGRRFAEARTWLEKARADHASRDEIALRIAAIDFEEGRTDAAESAVQELLKSNATAQAWALQAQFLFRQKKMTEAIVAAQNALSLDRQLVPAQNVIDAIRRQQLWDSSGGTPVRKDPSLVRSRALDIRETPSHADSK